MPAAGCQEVKEGLTHTILWIEDTLSVVLCKPRQYNV